MFVPEATVEFKKQLSSLILFWRSKKIVNTDVPTQSLVCAICLRLNRSAVSVKT